MNKNSICYMNGRTPQKFFSLSRLEENVWTLIDPTGFTRVWILLSSDQLELYRFPSKARPPVLTFHWREVQSVSTVMGTLVCIVTPSKKFYLQKAGFGVDGHQEQQNLVRALQRWLEGCCVC